MSVETCLGTLVCWVCSRDPVELVRDESSALLASVSRMNVRIFAVVHLRGVSVETGVGPLLCWVCSRESVEVVIDESSVLLASISRMGVRIFRYRVVHLLDPSG